ncbi:MAG: helix-turn-helix domain-containing protein [Acidobacteriota bacterium]
MREELTLEARKTVNGLTNYLSSPDLTGSIPKHEIPETLASLEALKAKLLYRLVEPGDTAAKSEIPDKLLSVDEAAGRLSFKRQYLYDLIRRRQFPAVSHGRYVRVREADISAWIEAHHNKVVDGQTYATPTNRRCRVRASADPKEDGAYVSRIRGPRRRSVKLDCAPSSERDQDMGATRPIDAASGSAALL